MSTPTIHAQGNEPFSIVDDSSYVFAEMRDGNEIFRVDKATQQTTMVASLPRPKGLAIAGEYLYVAVSGNNENRIVRLPKK